MANWTNVPDSVLEPGDPIRSVDIIAIKDNIEHYAENNGATTVFTSPGTWTKPATVKRIKVTVVGGGGGRVSPQPPSVGGGGGGTAIRWIPAPTIPGPVAVTRGEGSTGSGGTSSFGAFASATGGKSGVALETKGGSGSSGDLNINGGDNPGGGTFLAQIANNNGNLYGGGASDVPGSNRTGADGVVIVEEFY